MKKTRTEIELSIYGDNFDINLFSKKIGITPTNSREKCDINKKNTKAPARFETNWEYSTGYREGYFIEKEINQIIDKFNDKIILINDFVKKYNLNTRISIVSIIKNNRMPALYLDKKFLMFISKIGADIDMNIYIS